VKEGWQRLKYLVEVNARDLDENVDPGFEFRYLDIGSVGRGVLFEEPERMTLAEAPSRARRLVQSGDTIVSTVRTYLRAVWPVQGETDDLIVSTGFAVLSPGSRLDARYLGWVAQSDPVIEEIVARSVGVSYPAINGSEIGDIAVPIPSLSAQRAIADYLAAETARIESLVAAEQRRAELAVSRVVALTQALVLGRVADHSEIRNEPGGPLQPVPPAWTLRRNKSFMKEVADLSTTGQEELLTVSHITGVTPRAEKDVTMFLADTNEGYKLVGIGDLVINTMWAWMGALGVSRTAGIVSPAYGVYRFVDPAADPRYFDALFRSPAYVVEMTRYSKGVWTSRLRLYPESFLAIRTPFPPPEEQARIADAVEELHAEQDRQVNLFIRGVELLKERRQALITAAVTGQIEIPGVAA
jgi:type I restriction enzyme S subunit